MPGLEPLATGGSIVEICWSSLKFGAKRSSSGDDQHCGTLDLAAAQRLQGLVSLL